METNRARRRGTPVGAGGDREEGGDRTRTPAPEHTPNRALSAGRAWGTAVWASLAGMLLCLVLSPYLPVSSLLLIPLVVVLLAAYMGGLGPGLLATALPIAPGLFLQFLPEASRPNGTPTGSQLFGFAFLGILLSVLCDRRGPTIARIEEERRRAQESADAAREAEQRLHLLLDGIRDYVIAMLDPQGRITSWNAGGRHIQGWDADEVEGQHYSVLFRPEERSEGHPERILGAALGEGGYREAEGWLARKDGEPYRASIAVTPIFDGAGRVRGFTLVVADVTARAQAEEERERLLAQVRQANQWQRTFLREVLFNVTEGRLRLCERPEELPEPLEQRAPPMPLRDATSLRALRQAVEEVAREEGFPTDRWQDLISGVGEIAMNAVVHAGGGEGRLCARPGRTLQVRVEDTGGGMTLGTLHRATLEKGYTTAGTMGYGWFVTLQTVDRVWLLTGPSGTTVVLEQDITAGDDAAPAGSVFWSTAEQVPVGTSGSDLSS
jgi:PAS domain S-box